jgi:acyl-coenzyme A synthetase/AMP-(fatty) acid ligase
VDEALNGVAPGEAGELLMTGPQLTPGYWRNANATASAYVTPPGKTTIFYRTGDRVRRPLNGGPLTYIGRVDDQIKVLGHRVELGEVESALRAQLGVTQAVALGWPLTPSGAGGIVAFVTGANVDTASVRSALQDRLPGYAVPHAVTVLPELPLNSNGKVDRPTLQRMLEA